MRRIWRHNILFYFANLSGFFYKAPVNLNYWYNFGFIALFFLVLQILTGIFLAIYYVADYNIAFGLVFDICVEEHFGWWIKSVHTNGASYFFFIVYLHMIKNILYGSFMHPRQWLWITGALLWLLMVFTAFVGYVLPWGQMSYWGAVVITNLLASIPFIGPDILMLLWGTWNISDVTLKRFFVIHFVLPFIIAFVSMIHILLLHEYGSTNKLGYTTPMDKIPFIPYYLIKDLISLIVCLLSFSWYCYVKPEFFTHVDNFVKANHLVTPYHIVPEWYFLPLYAILRSVPSKSQGILLVALFILSIFLLPFVSKNAIIRSGSFRPFYIFFAWSLICICFMLGWIGGAHVITPYIDIGHALTNLYFFIFFVCIPVVCYFEKLIYMSYILRFKMKK